MNVDKKNVKFLLHENLRGGYVFSEDGWSNTLVIP